MSAREQTPGFICRQHVASENSRVKRLWAERQSDFAVRMWMDKEDKQEIEVGKEKLSAWKSLVPAIKDPVLQESKLRFSNDRTFLLSLTKDVRAPSVHKHHDSLLADSVVHPA